MSGSGLNDAIMRHLLCWYKWSACGGLPPISGVSGRISFGGEILYHISARRAVRSRHILCVRFYELCSSCVQTGRRRTSLSFYSLYASKALYSCWEDGGVVPCAGSDACVTMTTWYTLEVVEGYGLEDSLRSVFLAAWALGVHVIWAVDTSLCIRAHVSHNGGGRLVVDLSIHTHRLIGAACVAYVHEMKLDRAHVD
ncbi:hypothetical protein Tco_0470838 [Tanacetum coccineum]